MFSQDRFERVAVQLGRWWPTCLRVIPDLCDDHIDSADETKLIVSRCF